MKANLSSAKSMYLITGLLTLILTLASPFSALADNIWQVSLHFKGDNSQSSPNLWQGEATTLHVMVMAPPQKNNLELQLPQSPKFSLSKDKTVLVRENDKQGIAFPVRVVPLVSGQLTLPAFTLTDGQSQYQTQPMTLNISAPENSDQMELITELSAQEIWLGQSVRLTTTWIFDYPVDALKAVNLLQPELLHSDIKAYTPWDHVDPHSRLSIGLPVSGRRIIAQWKNLDSDKVQIQFTQVLKPESAGSYQFPAASLSVSLRKRDLQQRKRRYGGSIMPSYFNNNFFETTNDPDQYLRLKAQAQPLSFKVKPLPAGAPQNFSGIVGQPLITAEVSPTEAQQGQQMQYTLNVQHPDIEAIKLPPLQQQNGFSGNFNLPSAPAPAHQEGSVKIIHQSIFPNSAETTQVPAYVLNYFDPISGQYKDLKLDAIPVKISARETFELSDAELSADLELKNEVAEDPKGVWAHKWGSELTTQQQAESSSSHWLWLLIAPPLFILVQLIKPWLTIRQEKLRSKPYFCFKQSVQQDGEGIRHFTRYCQDRLSLAPSQCTPANVSRYVQPIDAELSHQICNWMSEVEQSYGTNHSNEIARLTPEATRTILTLLQKLEMKLEQHSKQASSHKVSTTLSALLATLCLLLTTTPEVKAAETQPVLSGQLQTQLNTLHKAHLKALKLAEESPFQAKKAHAAVAQKLTDLLDNTELNQASLMYNIGTSWFHAGRYGYAILWLKRAAMLAPDDEQVHHNLAKARGERLDALPRYFAPAWYATLYRLVSHTAWLWATILLYLWLCYSLYQYARGRLQGGQSIKIASKRINSLMLSGALCAIALIGLMCGIQYPPKQSEGVITQKSTNTRKGPSDLFAPATNTQLHQGTEFILHQQRDGWMKIELSSGVIAWVPEKAVGLF